MTHSTRIVQCLFSALGAGDTSVTRMGRNPSSSGVYILESGDILYIYEMRISAKCMGQGADKEGD